MPRPELQQLMDYYAEDYRSRLCAGADVADLARFPKDNLFYYNRGQSIAELIGRHVGYENCNVLDIGAGFGHILHAIAERFPRATRFATEFSGQSIRHLKSLGIQVFEGDIEDALAQLPQNLSLVIMSHVFEHLSDLAGSLELIHKWLSPGGILYIEVPNIPAWGLLQCPDHVWAPRFDEPHISFFSTPVLRTILEGAGFEVDFCDTAGPEYRMISGWRYNMPTMRWLVQDLMPAGLFHYLRRQKFMNRFKVPDRVDAFFQYGGPRVWIRTVSRKP
jgi:SAM-dependent methyltransferase